MKAIAPQYVEKLDRNSLNKPVGLSITQISERKTEPKKRGAINTGHSTSGLETNGMPPGFGKTEKKGGETGRTRLSLRSLLMNITGAHYNH